MVNWSSVKRAVFIVAFSLSMAGLGVWLVRGGFDQLRIMAHRRGATTTELVAQYIAAFLAIGGTTVARWRWELNWFLCILFVAFLLALEVGVVVLLAIGPVLGAIGLFILISLVFFGSRWLTVPLGRAFGVSSRHRARELYSGNNGRRRKEMWALS